MKMIIVFHVYIPMCSNMKKITVTYISNKHQIYYMSYKIKNMISLKTNSNYNHHKPNLLIRLVVVNNKLLAN